MSVVLNTEHPIQDIRELEVGLEIHLKMLELINYIATSPVLLI